MASFVVLGAGGFLGTTLLAEKNLPLPVKAVGRSIPTEQPETTQLVDWVIADLRHPGSLDAVIESGDIVVNLAYMSDAGGEANLRLIDNVIASAVKSGAQRVLHCSTAVVAGSTKATLIDEDVRCEPATSYQKTKLAVERRVLEASRKGLDVGILRPTAIVGPGGRNLLKLANAIRSGNGVVNYLRASLFGRRPMHLVSARDVVGALLHLATLPGKLRGNIYIVASDFDPENNFASVEPVLAKALGRKIWSAPPIPMPRQVLPLMLKARGNSDADPARVYSSMKLTATGFCSVESVSTAVRKFGESLSGDAG